MYIVNIYLFFYIDMNLWAKLFFFDRIWLCNGILYINFTSQAMIHYISYKF